MDGASVSDIAEMLEDTNEFERISKKLNMLLCETLITDFRRYYKAYEDYLLHIGRYKTFEIIYTRMVFHTNHIQRVMTMNKTTSTWCASKLWIKCKAAKKKNFSSTLFVYICI